MHDPYTPPKAQLDIETPIGKGFLYYQIANWVYVVIVSALLVFLVNEGEIKAGLSDMVVLIFMLAPVGGFLSAMYAAGYVYKIWQVIHLIFVAFLIVLAASAFHDDDDAFAFAVIALGINLLSVITSIYFKRVKREKHEPVPV
jgi:hypothetical protein